ncbi:deuterosome assembly protein 1 isoform X1 [Hyperolius riggenbachi]|uniref:deuterosome assembly protein 1 isoform X1 n=1 Tax=Hyperolius riggenbachi TaxID=752182 RepID=UPI0035A2E479
MRMQTENILQLGEFKEQRTLSDVSCENELEELMQQIDIMVNSKRVEWEKQVCILEQKLQARDQELTVARGALDQKDCEIRILSKKLQQADHSREETIQNYEKQLEALKSQLSKLKKSYEKLQYYHVGSQKSGHTGGAAEQERSRAELTHVTQQQEDYRVQAEQWEEERLIYQNNLKALTEQKKSLAEKCDFLQSQSRSYQEQLSSRAQLQGQLITNNQSEIRRLRCQLDTSQETITSDRVIIEGLRSAVKEMTLSRDSLRGENQRLLQELSHCQRRCQRMESKAAAEPRRRDDLVGALELDHRERDAEVDQYHNSQVQKLSYKESDVRTSERAANREQVQKRAKLSHCEQNEAGKDLLDVKPGGAGLDSLRADIHDLTAKLSQQDVTMATLSEKVCELERGLHGREPGDISAQASHCAEECGVPGLCSVSSVEEEEPVKCRTGGQERLDELPERMISSPWSSEAYGPQSQANQQRSEEGLYSRLKQLPPDSTCNGDTWLSAHQLDPYHTGWDTPSQSLLIDQSCLDAILPKIKSELCQSQNGRQFPEMNFLLLGTHDISASLGGNESFLSAAERFLQDEDRRAGDFERTLNSHIEELQRQSEHTVTKYTAHDYSRYIMSS